MTLVLPNAPLYLFVETMTRRYASHSRRIRARIDPNADFDWDLDRLVETGEPTPPTDAEVFEALSFKSSDVEYREEKKPLRTKGEYHSRTRDVFVNTGKDRVYGWLTLSDQYGLFLTTASPLAEQLVTTVCRDIRSFHLHLGMDASPLVISNEVQYEEIATWIPKKYIDRLFSCLHIIARYAESHEWTISHAKDGNRLIIHNLFLHPSQLTAIDNPKCNLGNVRLDVKLYRTGSHNQDYKLEFQLSLPSAKRGIGFISASLWTNVIQATGLKLMDAFLECCGIEETYISSGQASKVRELPRIPYEPQVLEQLHSLSSRARVALRIPGENDHRFRRKPITHSDAKRSPIPAENDHLTGLVRNG